MKANAPIEIVNDALGYKVYYYLTDFWSQKEDYLINGNIRFEEINASNESQALNWAKNRDKAFRNSYNYFFKMLIDRTLKQKGFQLSYPNKNEESKAIPGYAGWVPYDTTGIISVGDNPKEFKIDLKDVFEIRNTDSGEVSWIENRSDQIRINSQGFVLNPTDLVVSGVYHKNRIASLLPTSYQFHNSKTQK